MHTGLNHKTVITVVPTKEQNEGYRLAPRPKGDFVDKLEHNIRETPTTDIIGVRELESKTA